MSLFAAYRSSTRRTLILFHSCRDGKYSLRGTRRLELQADAANRDIKVTIARVEEAVAATGSARSYLFPTVSAQPQVARTREARNRPNNGNTGGRAATYNDIQLPLC